LTKALEIVKLWYLLFLEPGIKPIFLMKGIYENCNNCLCWHFILFCCSTTGIFLFCSGRCWGDFKFKNLTELPVESLPNLQQNLT